MMHLIASAALLAYTVVIYRIGKRDARPVQLEPLTWTGLDVPAVWRRQQR